MRLNPPLISATRRIHCTMSSDRRPRTSSLNKASASLSYSPWSVRHCANCCKQSFGRRQTIQDAALRAADTAHAYGQTLLCMCMVQGRPCLRAVGKQTANGLKSSVGTEHFAAGHRGAAARVPHLFKVPRLPQVLLTGRSQAERLERHGWPWL